MLISAGEPERFLSQVSGTYVPRKVVKVLFLKKDDAAIARLGYPLEESLYLCSVRKCFAKISDPLKVKAEMKRYMEGLKKEKQKS